MAPIGKLWTPASKSFKTRRGLAVAAYAGLEVEIPAEFTFGETNKTAEYLAKFPAGKVPAFEGAEGFNLSESIAIAYYFATLAPNAGLLGEDVETKAKIAQWVAFGDTELAERLDVANGMFNNYVPYVKPVFQNRIEAVVKALGVLEAHLATNTFLVGQRITLADISVASVLADGFSKLLGPEEAAKFPNSVRFLQTVIKNPKIAPVFEGVELASAAAVYTPPKKEAAPKAPKAEAAPKAPKAEKPKPAPAADEEEEESFADEPKAKNPLDSLPKSSFNLEEWKRQYSNTDTRKEAIPWLYENFDKEGFSLWKITFKYNEELTQPFMSNNQIGGFFNRLEASRKYLFGSMGVLGKANDSIITGCLILRGLEYEPVVSVAPDYESYEVTPLDLSNADDKAFLEAALAWDLTVGDKAWVDGKNFK